MATAPASYGQSERLPRGDYARANADYTCTQNYAAYTEQDHATYRRLYERQLKLLPGLACDAFMQALPSLGVKDRIPRFEELNERLYKATGWEIVGVPGLIPELPFFSLLAAKKFPVTDWIRTPAEMDYIVEPDLFHDMFGHVPLLFNPVFSDYVQRYGQGGVKAHGLQACELLARLYWYTIEFGLIRQSNGRSGDQPNGLRAYGAGILSSSGELDYAVNSPSPLRLPLELGRVMRTLFKIDSFQQNYFVIDSFDALFDMTAPDFAPVYESLQGLGTIAAGQVQEGELPMIVPV